MSEEKNISVIKDGNIVMSKAMVNDNVVESILNNNIEIIGKEHMININSLNESSLIMGDGGNVTENEMIYNKNEIVDKDYLGYVAVGFNCTAYSDDGVNWTRKDFSGDLRSICYVNNKYVAVGDHCTAYSEDGVNWTKKDFNGTLNSVCYVNNKYVAVGNYCTAYSTDGINWTKKDFNGNLYGVCYGNISSNISFNIDSSGNGSLTNNNTSLTLTTIPLHDAYNISCSNIIHYGYPEDSINNYAIGKPVFFTNNTYRLNNNAYTLNKISYQQTEEENVLSDDCIYGISLNSSYPFIGVVKEIDKTNNIIIFITYGIYLFTVSNSSNYNIGDIIDYNDNKVTVSDNASLKNNIVGICVGKIDNSKI